MDQPRIGFSPLVFGTVTAAILVVVAFVGVLSGSDGGVGLGI